MQRENSMKKFRVSEFKYTLFWSETQVSLCYDEQQ